MTKSLVLSFPVRNCAWIKKKFNSTEEPWLYLGQSFFKRRYLQQALGNRFKLLNISKLHDEVANDIRLEHVRWIDAMNRSYGNNLEWWFNSISSRDIYNSNLFQYCCYLEILERLWNRETQRPKLVIVESLGLARAILKWTDQKNIAVEVMHYNRGKLRSTARLAIPVIQWIRFFVTLLSRSLAAYFSKKSCKPKRIKGNSVVVLDTYVHDNCLLKDGVFKDRYYPYLHEYLRERGITVVVHPVLFGFRYNYFSIYQRMRQSDTYFILREDFLHFSDYLYALTYPFRFVFQKIKPIPFRGFNLSDILREEKGLQLVTTNLEAILIYRLFLRLAKAHLHPKLIISWYENQVIDKALIAGARQAFPGARIIGAQMFLHSPNYLNLFPSQSEVEARIAPDILLETSKYQCSVARSFTDRIPCRPAAALRYAHLFNNEKNNTVLKDKNKTILVLLSFSIAEGIELLEALKEILNQIEDDVCILIKSHPDYSFHKLECAFGKKNWPVRFEIFLGALPDALDQASLVISANSSSMVEAAVKGTPVIFFGRQSGLSHNILSNLNIELVTECFSPAELSVAINKYLNLSLSKNFEFREIGMKLRDMFFEPVNVETLSPFLGV